MVLSFCMFGFRGRSGGWRWAYWWGAYGWFWTSCTPRPSATRATPGPISSNMFTICISPSFWLSSRSLWWFVLVWRQKSPNLSRWDNTHYTETCMSVTLKAYGLSFCRSVDWRGTHVSIQWRRLKRLWLQISTPLRLTRSTLKKQKGTPMKQKAVLSVLIL